MRIEEAVNTEPRHHSGIPRSNGDGTGTGTGVTDTMENSSVVVMDLTDLPSDVFLLVVSHLSPQDSILCRRVSRAWLAAFATHDVSWHLMRWHFPRCREMRDDVAVFSPGGSSSNSSGSSNSNGGAPKQHQHQQPQQKQKQQQQQQPSRWTEIFPKVARRYHHLKAAKPRLIEKIDVVQEGEGEGEAAAHHQKTTREEEKKEEKKKKEKKNINGPLPLPFRGVEPWNRHLRFDNYRADFQYRDPTWCVDDGLLVYQERSGGGGGGESGGTGSNGSNSAPGSGSGSGSGRWVAYDLETRHRFSIPFESGPEKNVTVRRLRLACGVLIFEWCEAEPYHQLNDRETVHRHFATAFDVQRSSSPFFSSSSSSSSSASASASASASSSSSSSSNSSPPPPHITTIAAAAVRSSSSSPARASFVRSTAPPSSWRITFRSEWKIHLLGLPLAGGHDRFFSAHTAHHYALYLWQPNRSPWGRGRGRGEEEEEEEEDPLEQLTVWDISFPSAYRPSLDPTGAARPPDPGLAPFVARRFGWRELDEVLGLRQRRAPSLRAIFLDERNVYAHEEDHRWLAGPHAPPSPPRNHTVRCTGVPFLGLPAPRWFDECCADGDVDMRFCPRRRGGGGGGFSKTAAARHVGKAPCWRHEEFPYLTVSDAVDARAGVRIVARQCFMMEALSAFVSPRISVEGDEGEEGEEKGEGEEQGEVRFSDDMWGELMGKGRIAGDERWVVGEDREGRVTVVRF